MKRIQYLDALKGFCILLVVFCHYPLLPDNSFLGNIIMTFAWAAVPCFMIVTGGLTLYSSSFEWNNYQKKVITTYLTIVFWKAIYLIAYNCVKTIIIPISDIINYLFFFGSIIGVDDGVMWYMNAYLMVIILSPLLYHLYTSNKKLLLYITSLAFLSGIAIPTVNWITNTMLSTFYSGYIAIDGLNSILPFVQWANMLFYYLLGGYLVNPNQKVLFKTKGYISPYFLWLWVG